MVIRRGFKNHHCQGGWQRVKEAICSHRDRQMINCKKMILHHNQREREIKKSCLIEKLLPYQASLPAQQRQQKKKIELIHKILDRDAQIRAITEPWMTHLQNLLINANQKRKLDRLYKSS